MKHVLIILAVCVFVVSTLAYAQVPQTISYQGLLTTSSGTPIADGNYDLTFKLYTVLTGGTPAWTETQSSVPVSKGTFSVVLGNTTPFTGVSFAQQLYLGTTKDSDPEFSPRSALTSAPSSLAPWTINGSNINYVSGNVGIGTTSPGTRLTVVNADNLPGDILQLYPQNLTHGIGFEYRGIRAIGSNGNNPLFIDAQTSGGLLLQTFSTGNVGIGTTNPTAGKLVVQGGNLQINRPELPGQPTFAVGFQPFGSAGVNLQAGGNISTDLYLQAAGGNVGIGTTSPGRKLHIVESTNNSGIRLGAPGNQMDVVSLFEGGKNSLGFYNDLGQTLLRVHNAGGETWLAPGGGNVGIGTTTPAALLHVNGTAGNPGGVWSSVSDERLKKNVTTLTGALEKVEQLRPVTFEWKDPSKQANMDGRYMGFIAQEVEKVIPEWVKPSSDGYKWLEKVGVEALLVQAIKEQQKEIEELKAMVKSLAKQIQAKENTSLGELK